MSGESPRALERATDAFHASFLAGRSVAILYGGHDAAIDRGRLKNAIRDALAVADEVERPVAERLAAALRDLLDSNESDYYESADAARAVLADFATIRAHSTDGD